MDRLKLNLNIDFVVTEWMNEWEMATKKLLDLVQEDKIRYTETITKGFENAPQALRDVLTGKKFWKTNY